MTWLTFIGGFFSSAVKILEVGIKYLVKRNKKEWKDEEYKKIDDIVDDINSDGPSD